MSSIPKRTKVTIQRTESKGNYLTVKDVPMGSYFLCPLAFDQQLMLRTTSGLHEGLAHFILVSTGDAYTVEDFTTGELESAVTVVDKVDISYKLLE